MKNRQDRPFMKTQDEIARQPGYFIQLSLLSLITATILLFFSVPLTANELQLSAEEKLEDFEHLYEVLENNYMYFEVNRRLNDLDWLSNYDDYRAAVLETEDDKEFYQVIQEIIKDLRQGHSNVLWYEYYDYYVQAFSQAAEAVDSIYQAWVEELTKEQVTERKDFWLDIQKGRNPQDTAEAEEDVGDKPRESNIFFHKYPESEIALIGFKTFRHEYMETDRDSLLSIYSELDYYRKLIIDIQGNSGGSTRYWSELIVPLISPEEYKAEFLIAFRNSDFVERFFPQNFRSATDSLPDLPELPPELYEWDVLFDTLVMSTDPDSTYIDFKGDIYLLVDQYVYSASEAFALFSRYSGFATVAGTVTGGDGIGRDPVIFSLPNSGLVIQFPVFWD